MKLPSHTLSAFVKFFMVGMVTCSTAQAATILIGNGPNNTVIPDTYGDNVTASGTGITASTGAWGIMGTPNIDLTWTSSGSSGGNSGKWEFHTAASRPSTDGGQMQLDGCQVNSSFNILFTPDASYGVYLGSFNFANDSGGTVSYDFMVSVVDVTAANSVVFTHTQNWSFSSASTINDVLQTINYQGAVGHVLQLNINRISGGTGAANDIYIDNLAFDQVVAVPEPSTYAMVAGAGLLGWVALRRRKQVL